MTLRILFILLLLSLVSYASAQPRSDSHQQIDSLVTVAQTMGRGDQDLEPLASKMITLSNKEDYAKGRAYGYFFYGLTGYYKNDYGKSISSLDKAMQEKEYLETDALLYSAIHRVYGSDYNFLGLNPLAKQHFLKAVEWAKKKSPNTVRKQKAIELAYLNLISMYMLAEQAESIRRYADEFKNISAKLTGRENEYLNVMYGTYHLFESRLDSASHYFKKGYTYFKNTPEPYREIALHGLARVAYQRKNYQQALTYDQQALSIPTAEAKVMILKHIADIYNRLEKNKKEREYLNRYKVLQDSLLKAHKAQRATLLKTVLEDIDENHKQERQQRVFKGALILLFVLGIAGIIIFYFYRKNRNQKQALGKNEEKLASREEDIQSLNKKINTAFEEVVNLAKNNDPAFFARFREVYPYINKKLSQLDPSLTDSELEFCAMLHIGFSTKDIAEYTHIQPRSVQMKKYRLRKKMELPKGKNLQEWVKSL